MNTFDPSRYDRSVFKPYDIRGIVPTQIDGDFAEQVGRAFAGSLKPRQAVVGYDVRHSAQEFKTRVIEGLTRSGVDVIDIGQVSTDAYYYACGSRKLPGIMVTASHNPSEYNGFKMVRSIPHLVIAKEFADEVLGKTYEDAPTRGKVENLDIIDEFLEHMLSIVPPEKLKPLKVVIDSSNGTQGPIWERLVSRLPITIVPICSEPDGDFPNHPNDVIQLEAQEMLREAVKKEEADLGLIFDPDGDRCLLVDDRGETVPGDFITALIGVAVLNDYPGGTVLYDVRASDAVPDLVEAAGGKAFVWKPGHAFIKAKMQDIDAVFGGEVSGHYYFKSFWSADCGLLAGLTILEYVSSLSGPLSEAVSALEREYILSGEINSTVKDRKAVIDLVKRTYHDAETLELSGIAIRYPDWHCVVRPSDTEPLVRLTVEARSRALMEEKRDELLGLIRG